MGSGFAKKKKQAKLFEQQFSQLQNQMQNTDFEGVSGNGLVQITLSGEGDLKEIKIRPECVDPEDVTGLETLIKAAFKDASEKVKAQPMNLMGSSGLPFGL